MGEETKNKFQEGKLRFLFLWKRLTIKETIGIN